MDCLLKLRFCYSGTVFCGIFPEEIETLIFKISWFLKIKQFNTSFLKMVCGLKNLNIPLTENCDLKDALNLYHTSPVLTTLESMVTSFQKKKIASPYKWWNTRIPLHYIYRQNYFISEHTQNYNNNWYYQEEYKIVVPRFYYCYLEGNYMKIIDYTNKRNNTQYIKRYNNIELTEDEWSNRGVNNKKHSIYPEGLREKKIIYHFNLEEDYPIDFTNICYYC